MKVQNVMAGAAVAVASWTSSSANSIADEKLNNTVATPSPKPITNTLEFNYLEHDRMQSATSGDSFYLEEVELIEDIPENACEIYGSPEFEKIKENCDLGIKNLPEVIHKKNQLLEAETAAVIGGTFSVVLCLGMVTIPFVPIPLIPTITGVALMNRFKNELDQIEEEGRKDIPSCIKEDFITEKCIDHYKETYGLQERGHLRG